LSALTVDAVLALPGTAALSVKDMISELTIKIGEKIDIRRVELMKLNGNGLIGSYVHSGKIGVLVKIEADKEVVTDALKRAMRSFGNQFGNSLYDKTKNHQANNESIPSSSSRPQQTNYRQSSPTQTVTTNHNGNIKQSYDPYEYESLFRIGYQQNQNYHQKPPQNNQQQQPYQNGNRNINNVNQKPLQHSHQSNPQQQQSFQNNQSFDQYEYQPLYNLGLDVQEQNGFLIVTGENQYSYRDAIKVCGFLFDAKSKKWYKKLEQGVA
jgi:DNA repair and recombination protein RAD52